MDLRSDDTANNMAYLDSCIRNSPNAQPNGQTSNTLDNIPALKSHHSKIRPQIKARLREFEEAGRGSADGIFKELCFCVLTANTSAEMCIRAVDAAGDAMLGGDVAEISAALKACGYRYPNARAKYIAYNWEHVKGGLAEKIASCTDAHELRDYLVKNVKGLGYKESSHFMRNIGFKGLAILDKHILSGLVHFGVVSESGPPKNRQKYLEIEAKMRRFACEIGIDMDELDLLLWSRKTGKILK